MSARDDLLMYREMKTKDLRGYSENVVEGRNEMSFRCLSLLKTLHSREETAFKPIIICIRKIRKEKLRFELIIECIKKLLNK